MEPNQSFNIGDIISEITKGVSISDYQMFFEAVQELVVALIKLGKSLKKQ